MGVCMCPTKEVGSNLNLYKMKVQVYQASNFTFVQNPNVIRQLYQKYIYIYDSPSSLTLNPTKN